MSLREYKKKRSFRHTPEPAGGAAADTQLIFTVQKHNARQLHYDFRLEMGGVLKSWAVPKGPPKSPAEKRLAIHVEDHPYDYKDFEGVIPKGNYGAGTVEVWDHGTYEPDTPVKNKKEAEKLLLKELAAGSLKFTLHGEKLKGSYALVHIKGNKKDNAWLLLKHKEDKKSPKRKAAQDDPAREPFPGRLKPMLATLVDKVSAKENWLYEIKWDGYRAIAYCQGDKVKLISRNDQSYNERFYPLCQKLEQLRVNAVLDGEVVVLKKGGVSSFGALQNWRTEKDGQLMYYIFDILWLDGRNLMDLPLTERKKILHKTVKWGDPVRESVILNKPPEALLQAAQRKGMEGIIAKDPESAYLPGHRGLEWVKLKTQNGQEVVIGGYTLKDDSPKLFSSLLAGVYDKGKFRYKGRIGTGFDVKVQQEMMKLFRPLKTSRSPFEQSGNHAETKVRLQWPKTSVVWLKPELICEVNYSELTSDGLMRHPSFKGMREDKKAKDVHPEKIRSAKGNGKAKDSETGKPEKISGKQLTFTHPDKVYWPKEGYTKGDLLKYYHTVAPYILPYLLDRPHSLNRFPNGIAGKSFFQKDISREAPEWIEKMPYHTDTGGDRNFLVVNNEASMLWMVNLGVIEINPWSSTVEKPDDPDWCILDLDPSEKNSFEEVIQAAQATQQVLKKYKITGYPKISGATGIHIYIPMQKKLDYEQCQLLAKFIAVQVNELLPEITTIERVVKKRKGKIYIDFLQNRPQATLAAPYSVRPRPGAPVSMPLYWEEVKRGLKPLDFTMKNAMERIRAEGDIFKPVLGRGPGLQSLLTQLKNNS